MEASRLQKTNKAPSRSKKHVFIPPGALGKGRRHGLRSYFGSSSWDASIETVNNSTLTTNAPIAPPDDTHHSTQEAASKRNSENRAKLSMPHRTGSKPFRQIIYKKGGKDGNPPSLATIFFETRKKGGQLEGDNTNKKYDQILEASQSQPQLSNIELIEKCFGPQCRQYVICYGGGVKPTDLKPSYSSRAELHAKLCETEKENQSLRSRMDGMEAELQKIKEMLQQHNSTPPPSPSEGN